MMQKTGANVFSFADPTISVRVAQKFFDKGGEAMYRRPIPPPASYRCRQSATWTFEIIPSGWPDISARI